MKNKKVLVLEDSQAAMIDLISKLPPSINREDVLPADNYHQAMDFLREEPIGLALVDLSMPKKNGMDFIHELRNDPAYSKIRIIVITGVDTNSLLLHALTSLNIQYLHKPVIPEELETVIEADLIT